MAQAPTHRLTVAGLAAIVLVQLEGVASACPACAVGSDGDSPWLVALLIATPIVGFAATALVIRRLVARAGRS